MIYKTDLSENQISQIVIKNAIKVHNKLGPGLLESAYSKCLTFELMNDKLLVEREKDIHLFYNDIRIDKAYRIDLLINREVIIEIKAVSAFTEVHLAQILTYLKLTDCKLGLLINFNVKLLKNGIKRVVNNL
jgi:GxxExxY protein